jgi:cold shock CspA family protein
MAVARSGVKTLRDGDVVDYDEARGHCEEADIIMGLT